MLIEDISADTAVKEVVTAILGSSSSQIAALDGKREKLDGLAAGMALLAAVRQKEQAIALALLAMQGCNKPSAYAVGQTLCVATATAQDKIVEAIMRLEGSNQLSSDAVEAALIRIASDAHDKAPIAQQLLAWFPQQGIDESVRAELQMSSPHVRYP